MNVELILKIYWKMGFLAILYKILFAIVMLIALTACDSSNEQKAEKKGTDFSVYNKDSTLIARGSFIDSMPHGSWYFFDNEESPIMSINFNKEESKFFYTIYSYHEKKLLYRKVVVDGEVASSELLDYKFVCSPSIGQLLYRNYFSDLFMMEGLKGRVNNNNLTALELEEKLISYQNFYRSKGIVITNKELSCVIEYIKL